MNWDRFSYVQNNPLRYTDHTGHYLDDGCQMMGCSSDKRDLTSWTVAAAVDIVESKENKALETLNSTGIKPFKVAAYVSFYNLVADGQKYDVKDKIKGELGETIKLGDNWYEYSTPGNILYGFYGLAAGFSESELHAGGGVAQILDYLKHGDIPGGPLTFFDTKVDYYAIEFGFYLYTEYYENDGILTVEEFLDALEEFTDVEKLDIAPPPEDYYPAIEDYDEDVFYH